jgi:hypothetical protein
LNIFVLLTHVDTLEQHMFSIFYALLGSGLHARVGMSPIVLQKIWKTYVVPMYLHGLEDTHTTSDLSGLIFIISLFVWCSITLSIACMSVWQSWIKFLHFWGEWGGVRMRT